jgi:hypothetical protein
MEKWIGGKRENVASDIETDEYVLERISQDNDLAAEFLLPYAVVRLSGNDARVQSVVLSVSLRDVLQAREQIRRLQLLWTTPFPEKPLPLQAKPVTEQAACAVAFVFVPLYAQARVVDVAESGDRFDYWVINEECRLGLEVSGTITGNLQDRHREKVDQLMDNPYGVDGYVAVVRFGTREAIFSFHEYGEEL